MRSGETAGNPNGPGGVSPGGMDIPRDPNEVRRQRRRHRLKWVGIGLAPLALLALALLLPPLLRRPARIIPLPPPSPLPDSLWLARIEERAADLSPLSSLLVSFEDTLIAEHYFEGMRADRAVNVKSVSKTILSALVGVALDRGDLPSLEVPVAEFLPEYFDNGLEPVKREITLDHLVTMSAGLEGTSFDNYDRWVTSRDWVRYVLEQPVREPPGVRMRYSTGNTHLLSVILTRASGLSTLAYARRFLFDPLGIVTRAWDRDPQGNYLGGNNMSLTPLELLAFGRLYLDRGEASGVRVISPAWIDSSWSLASGRSGRRGYGRGWWYARMDGEDVWYAVGYGGQYLFVVPGLDLTVAATTRLGSGRRRPPITRLVSGLVIPAVKDRLRNRAIMRVLGGPL